MSDKKNVLVFPCGSEVALEIYASVRYSTHFHLIGGSSVDDHGRFVYKDYIGGLPFANDGSLIEVLRRIVRERQVSALYPAMDSVAAVLKDNEGSLGCRVVAPPAETTRTCLSKRKTYELLQGAVPLPKQFEPADSGCLDYPVFVKPDIGYGSKGASRIDDAESLRVRLKNGDNLLVLEYLPGQEYTIDCFTDRHGRLRYAAGRTRERIRNGISVRTALSSEQSEFFAFACCINEAMNLRGAWFAQVKRDANGVLRLMEVAARLGGSSSLARARGVNLALLSLYDAFGIDVHVHPNDYEVVLDRALSCSFKFGLNYKRVYVDFDDCLVLGGDQVNIELVAFLFQCMNRGIETVLLTKHQGDLNRALSALRLDGLFDAVVHIKQEDDKASFINNDVPAIFLDDSYAEREAVMSSCHIPTFSPDMVGSLME